MRAGRSCALRDLLELRKITREPAYKEKIHQALSAISLQRSGKLIRAADIATLKLLTAEIAESTQRSQRKAFNQLISSEKKKASRFGDWPVNHISFSGSSEALCPYPLEAALDDSHAERAGPDETRAVAEAQLDDFHAAAEARGGSHALAEVRAVTHVQVEASDEPRVAAEAPRV